MEVVASSSQGRTDAAQCGLFTHKSVPVIFEPPCISSLDGLLQFSRIFSNVAFLFLLSSKSYKTANNFEILSSIVPELPPSYSVSNLSAA